WQFRRLFSAKRNRIISIATTLLVLCGAGATISIVGGKSAEDVIPPHKPNTASKDGTYQQDGRSANSEPLQSGAANLQESKQENANTIDGEDNGSIFVKSWDITINLSNATKVSTYYDEFDPEKELSGMGDYDSTLSATI